MNIITQTPCGYCEVTGHRRSPGRSWRDPKRTCSQCVGTRYTEEFTSTASVTIGPGWFSNVRLSDDPRAQLGTPANLADPLRTAHRHDVVMLAACLGASEWPPRA